MYALCCVLKEREENTSYVCEGVPEFLVFVCVLLMITYVP